MSAYQMLSHDEQTELGLASIMVSEEEYAAAVARKAKGPAAAAADAALFEDGPQEAQEAASAEPEVGVEAGVARRPRRARRPAGGDDAGQFVGDDPATADKNEAYDGQS